MRARKSQRGGRLSSSRALVLLAVLGAASAAFVGTSSANLSGGSTFNSTNGALTSSSATFTHDWNPAGTPAGYAGPVEPINCATRVNCGVDLVNSQADDALGQGAKEDDTAPSVVTGSIPPSKDDLSRFYVNKEKVNSNNYLYSAWERSNLLGSAHMDFEFNQVATAGANGVTPVRTLGDLLIDFDFGGSGVPVLAKHTWVATANPSADCETSTTSPCWNKATNLTAGGFADGSVNNVNVIDNNPPGNPSTLPGNTKNGINSTFGEAAINLTAANIFPANKSAHFGSAYLKSRSSGNSFNSELKDFIAPIPVNISNCGEVKIIKRSSPRGVDQNFTFTSTLTDPAAPVTSSSSPYCQGDTSPSAFTLNDNGNSSSDSAANTEDCVNVLGGTYHVSETALPAGFVLDSLTCSVTGSASSTGSQDAVDPLKANITIAAGDVVTCTYVDKEQLGAIKVIKESSASGNAALAGAQFSIKDPNGNALPGSPFTTDANGVACVDGLTTLGSYKVQETAAPPHYAMDDTAEHSVTVTGSNAKCSDATFGGQTLTFTDTPIPGAIKITKKSDKSGHAVLAGAKFAIKDANGNALAGSPFTTDANGVACVDGLPALVNYTVQEVQAPSHYAIDDSTVHTVTVTDSNAKCSDASFGGQPLTFLDSPLTDLSVKVTSEDTGAGGSSSTITCSNDATAASIGNSPQSGGPANPVQVDANGLVPGDYTCKMHIDP